MLWQEWGISLLVVLELGLDKDVAQAFAIYSSCLKWDALSALKNRLFSSFVMIGLVSSSSELMTITSSWGSGEGGGWGVLEIMLTTSQDKDLSKLVVCSSVRDATVSTTCWTMCALSSILCVLSSVPSWIDVLVTLVRSIKGCELDLGRLLLLALDGTDAWEDVFSASSCMESSFDFEATGWDPVLLDVHELPDPLPSGVCSSGSSAVFDMTFLNDELPVDVLLRFCWSALPSFVE